LFIGVCFGIVGVIHLDESNFHLQIAHGYEEFWLYFLIFWLFFHLNVLIQFDLIFSTALDNCD